MKIAVICSALENANAGVAGVTASLVAAYHTAGFDADAFYFEDIARAGSRSRLAHFYFSLGLAFHRKLLDYHVIDIASSSAWVIVLRAHLFTSRRPLIVSRSHGLDHAVHEDMLCMKN